MDGYDFHRAGSVNGARRLLGGDELSGAHRGGGRHVQRVHGLDTVGRGLEQRGFVRGKWGVTESSRKARFYSITPAGQRQLTAEKDEWDRMVSIMRALLNEES